MFYCCSHKVRDVRMFLWGRVVQLPPVAQEVHVVQGNQEHQQYHDHPRGDKITAVIPLVSSSYWISRVKLTVKR